MTGLVSDELRSTPLMASLLELTAAGESAKSVDTGIIEDMAAAGRNFTIRTLALKTVNVAEKLYPGRPHARVFRKDFQEQGILP
jgi:hypothetical protein